LEILVDRKNIWNSTLKSLLAIKPADFILKKIRIYFVDEKFYDIGKTYNSYNYFFKIQFFFILNLSKILGGLRNEWLTLLADDIMNPDNYLFKLSSNKLTFQPNPFSAIVPDHLLHFEMLGRLVGKCLIEDYPFQVNFVKFFLKHILGILRNFDYYL
jgi:hypothetical protein